MANRTDIGRALAWNQVINNSNGHASLDYHYGPYDSIDDVPEAMRVTGFTCAVIEDGRPAEWWWTGSAWERKGVPSDVYVRYRGVAESLDALGALEAEAGDMYIVPVTGDGGQVEEYREYIRAEGRWELLGTRTAGVSGSLTVENAGDAFTVTDKGVRASSYNGTQNVTLDMGAFAKAVHDHDARYYTREEADASLEAGVSEMLGGDALKDAVLNSDWFKEAVDETVKTRLYGILQAYMNGTLVMTNGAVQTHKFSGASYDDLEYTREDVGVSISGGSVTAAGFYEEE